jgi:hypothetical protein
MARRIEPGSQWVLRRGVHSGTVVEVEGQSFAGSIKYRVVKKGDNTGGSREDDDGRVHTKPQDEFLTLYARNKPSNGVTTHSAFRQKNRSRKLSQEELELGSEAAEEIKRLRKADKPVSNGHYVHPGAEDLGIAIEMITPAMAQAWLERGGSNRRPSERLVQKLMRELQLGQWELTGETIKLDKDGKVRDGQHRLTAIIRTAITAPCIVVRGVKESAFNKIDTGKSRTMADVLSIHGHLSSISLATAARGLILIERYGCYEVGGVKLGYAAAPSNAEGLAYIEAHPEVAEAVKEADRLRKEGQFIGGRGLWAIALSLFWRIDPQQTHVFVDSLIEGANLEAGSPVLKLRNMYRGRLREWHSTNENRERLLATVIKGWNAWRRDELVQGLSWHNTGRSAEKFPVPE